MEEEEEKQEKEEQPKDEKVFAYPIYPFPGGGRRINDVRRPLPQIGSLKLKIESGGLRALVNKFLFTLTPNHKEGRKSH